MHVTVNEIKCKICNGVSEEHYFCDSGEYMISCSKCGYYESSFMVYNEGNLVLNNDGDPVFVTVRLS